MLHRSLLTIVARLLVVALSLLIAAPHSHAGQQNPQFTAAVHTVRVDVVVTDGQGEFIGDLSPDDFTLFEDGERQDIVSVELVDLAARQVQRLSPPAEVSTASGVQGPDANRASDLGAMVFFIDLPGLYFQNSIRFAESMERVLARFERLTIPYAVYLVDMAGRLRELQPLTVDRDALQEAAGDVRSTLASVSRENLFASLDAGAGVGTIGGGAARAARYEARARTIYTFGLLRDFVESLAHRSGRTALVWVSTGVDLASYETIARPSWMTGESNTQPGGEFRSYSPDLNVLRLEEELHRAANTANVSIYSVDPSALHDFYPNGIIRSRAGGAEDARGNSLRHAAHETGGDVFIGWSELDRVLENIERDAGRFYLLSYVPPGDIGAGEYHEIRIEVSRPDVSVRARKGYIRYSAEDRLSRAVNGALNLPGTVSGFDVAVQGTRARDANGQALLVIDSRVETGQRGPVGTQHAPDAAPLLAYTAVLDRGGKLVGSVQAEPLSRRVDSAAGAGDPRAPAYLTHRGIYRLEPGGYDVRVVVIDPRTERVGVARLDVEIEGNTREWDVSDPWLAVEDPDGELFPVVGGRVTFGQSVIVYLEVYNGVNPVLSGQVLPADGSAAGEAASDRDPDGALQLGLPLPPVAFTPTEGFHRATLTLPVLSNGDHVLELRIDDVLVGKVHSVRVPLRVVSPK